MDLYYTPGSVNCRSVLLAGKVFGIDFNLKLVNLMAGEHMTPEFLKLNPQHTLPTLVDNGFALYESRAILTYLAEKYGKCDDTWYPKCPKKRALIHQRFYFDMGTLSQKYGDYYYPQLFAQQPADPEKFKAMEAAVALFEQILEGQQYAAGDSLTLADLSLVATISTYDVSGFDLSKYPNIVRWYQKCKQNIPGYEVNQEGVDLFKSIFFPSN